MPTWLDDALIIVFLLSIVAFFFGIFIFIFKSGKRKAGAKLSGLSVIIFLTSLFGYSAVNNYLSKSSGFESQAIYNEAASYGVNSAAEWEDQKETLREQRRISEEQRASEREAERAAVKIKAERAAAAAAAEKAAEQQKGFHCLSGWDGSHSKFKSQVKSMMRNPSSFEHISTRVTPINSEGTHTIFMEYRAENGFGGMNVSIAKGKYSNSNCDNFAVDSLD